MQAQPKWLFCDKQSIGRPDMSEHRIRSRTRHAGRQAACAWLRPALPTTHCLPSGSRCRAVRDSPSAVIIATDAERTHDGRRFLQPSSTSSRRLGRRHPAVLPHLARRREQGRPRHFDPVTAADRAAETAMRTLIRQSFPEHGIIGEEFGSERTDAEYCWVLDPIDGTKSFISGMPAWGTLIALTRGGEPVYGMMHQPFTRERFTGDGSAARYRGPAGERALRVRRCGALGDAMLMTTSPLLMNETDRAAFGKVEAGGTAVALRRRLLRLLHAGGGPRRPRHRDRAQAVRHPAADPDHRRRRRHRHDLGRRLAARRRPHRRRRRRARARSGDEDFVAAEARLSAGRTLHQIVRRKQQGFQ